MFPAYCDTAIQYWNTNVFEKFVHPSGAFFAYSDVPLDIGVLTFVADLSTLLVRFRHLLAFPSGIGLPMLLRNLCTPLVRFSHALTCRLVSVYYCFSVI